MRPGISTLLTSTLVAAALFGCRQNESKLDRGAAPTGRSARTVDKPAKLEFFVMSQCPYGIQVEKGVAPALAKLGDNVDFHLAFIGDKKGDDLTSMHGPAEVAGDIAQLCAREVSPQKYMDMIACQNDDPKHVDTNWKSCSERVGIDAGAVQACIDGKGKQLLAASFDEAKQRGATGSPTMFLNGKPYEGGRKPNDFLRALCNSFAGKKPAACDNIPVPPAVNVVMLSDERCAKCKIDGLEGQLKQIFDGLVVKKLDYMSAEGKALFAELHKADASFRLPALLFDASIDADSDGKQQLARFLRPLGKYQSVALGGTFDPTAEICDNKVDDDANGVIDCDEASCKQTMSCRPETKKSLEVFVMSHCPYGTKALLATKEFADAFGKDAAVSVHFIGDSKDGQLSSMHGADEVTDDLREICAIEHYRKDQKFLDFLACRSKDLKADWKACTGANGIDAAVIESCVTGDEGKRLLAASFQVASKLAIQSSPTFLVNNRQTFNAQDAAGIATNYCKANPGLPGCAKQLSATAPAQAAGGGGAACGTP